MTNTCDVFSDKQKSAIRWLAEKRNGNLDRQAVIDATHLTRAEYEHLLRCLEQKRCVKIVPVDDGIYAGNFNVGAEILEVVRQLDSPPRKDYPKQIKTWFFSKWWSVPLWFAFVVVPLLFGYVTIAKLVRDWLKG